MTLQRGTLDLIRDFKTKMAAEFQARFKITQERFVPVLKPEGRKKRGDVFVNIEATESRLVERISKYSVLVQVYSTRDAYSCVSAFSVSVVDDEFKLVRHLIPINHLMTQLPLKLNSVVVDWVITTHALGRYLERNNTKDIKQALFVLANALFDLDQDLAKLSMYKNLTPVGYIERQVKCNDGGIAFIIIQDPADGDYRTMEWVLVSYISEDMVCNWNEQATKEEFKDLERADPMFPADLRMKLLSKGLYVE